MRRVVRVFSEVGPEQRVGEAIAQLPPAARRALAQVADAEDLPLVAGSWEDGAGGCLVANVLRLSAGEASGNQIAVAGRPGASLAATLDVRMLEAFPELSSRDLNRLIVAWDEAAMQEGRSGDPALRRLLRGALARAGAPASGASGSAAARAGWFPEAASGPQLDGLSGSVPSVTETSACSPSRT